MKVVVAPDSFKGCLSASEVAGIIVREIGLLHPEWSVTGFPLADGGEGTLDAVLPAIGGSILQTVVCDPLGRKVEAAYGMKGGLAIIEVSRACGLGCLAPQERNPLAATTYGVGELLMDARAHGAVHFLIGLGGTATCDGGAGMMRVPGIREAMQGCVMELLCDVDNPFVGPRGAARVFAPQKGASAEDVELLEARMEEMAATILRETGIDVRSLPGAGAAGGLGGAMMAWFGARTVSGIDRVMEMTGFDEAIKGADLIITGEGKSDIQTLGGKVPCGVLRHAGGIPVILVSGRVEDRAALEAAGFARMISVTPEGIPLSQAVLRENAVRNLQAAVRKI